MQDVLDARKIFKCKNSRNKIRRLKMDSGNGNFEKLDRERFGALLSGEEEKPERAGGIFSVGEELEIKGSRFRVKKITRKDLILRLLVRHSMKQGE